ncbi:biotin-dependent carboxyltransferase family protein [Carboxylicivirga sp. M1479]|uniref:5-oxoprolinase subunit C family protein n=1 Tax=Carboxylicivirga sp. M1479 TaxID=2594476 RepID=UPI0011784ECA|nr:biotin-dependent carboxyltransferase family protein [Carboxylicivirga sp. M1479]TRX66137.1 biotin-dependent carboxyltransferase [Carboxylicivirga sp. M1479]
MSSIDVIQAGLFTSIQDLGRPNYQHIGMPVGGAMDTFALQMANILVGNEASEACLEITMRGPVLKFNGSYTLAAAGGACELKLNETDISCHQSYKVVSGDVLKIGLVTEGLRIYLAISGGFNLPKVMGSHSTYLRGGLGGFNGRALKPDDSIPLKSNVPPVSLRKVREQNIPHYPKHVKLRFVAGPDRERFTKDGIYNFLNEIYTLSPQSDRMGYRLTGPVISHKNQQADIISSAIAFGTIQVPGEGQPIIMMADRQTVGGYARIAHVISADLHKLAQMKPGDTMRFVEVKLEEAHRLLKEQRNLLNDLYELSASDK